MTLTAPTAILLDETPLSLLTRKTGHAQGDACKAWFLALEAAGHRFYVPEPADYELRRELLRAGQAASVARLNRFNAAEPDRCLPLTTADWRRGAVLWARARSSGRTTAPPEALDGDVLIAAQAETFLPAAQGLSARLVATANLGHLSALTQAALWSDIYP